MDPDLSMIREEGGDLRPEAGAVRDELDNQARHLLERLQKFLKSFQRLSKTYKDYQRLTEISSPSKQSCSWIQIAVDHQVNFPNSR